MYSYSGSFGRPPVPLPPGLPGAPGFNFPPSTAGPPGVTNFPPGVVPGVVPGITAPGTAAPGTAAPGTAQPSLAQRPGVPNFVPPSSLPNINFNAPIIRLGTSSSSKAQSFQGGTNSSASAASSSAGGSGPRHHHLSGGNAAAQAAIKDLTAGFQVPTAEEQLKTLFIGSIPKDLDDEWMEKLLRAAASLRRWVRATGADNALYSFGFAEFDDFANLKVAHAVFDGLELPAYGQRKEKQPLKVSVDDKAQEYLEKIKPSDEGGSSESNESSYTARYESARTAVNAAVAEFANPERRTAAKLENGAAAPDSAQDDVEKSGQARPEIVTISLSVEDELSDIPADMRDVVAKEIAAFRERSNRRDLERIKREEEIERLERDKTSHGRGGRYSSPPASAPTGPSAGSNAIPVGPSRMRTDAPASAPTQPSRMANTPTGPSSYPSRDQTANGAKFVNENSGSNRLPQDDDDTDASDTELERRRREKKEKEMESVYQDHERRWLSRERSRSSAVDRETARDRDEQRRQEDEKAAMSLRLAEWDDDFESERQIEDYYIDHSQWIRNRAQFRAREKDMDERDKVQEQRQKEAERKSAAESAADSFLARQEEELESRQANQAPQAQPKIVLSLGASARKAHDSARPRRTVADVEGLLEDEEEDAARSKRVLIPIQYDDTSIVSEEKRDEMVKSLAQEIPADRDGLWNWDLKWEYIDEVIIKEKLQPFIEKKIVERIDVFRRCDPCACAAHGLANSVNYFKYLGVQEQELIDFVLEHVRKRGTADALVKELEMALDEDAEVLVKKIWRMLVFFSESEKRGLGP